MKKIVVSTLTLLSFALSANAALITGDFTADNDAAPALSQISAGAGVSSTFTNLVADGGFLQQIGARSDLTLTPNTNMNTGNDVGWDFDFTTTSALNLTDVDFSMTVLKSDGATQTNTQFNASSETWNYVRLTIFNSSDVSVGFLEYDLHGQTAQDFDSLGMAPAVQAPSLAFSLTGSTISLASGQTYTARFSAQETNISGAFFGTDSFAINGAVIPEPSSLALIGIAFASIVLLRRRRA